MMAQDGGQARSLMLEACVAGIRISLVHKNIKHYMIRNLHIKH